MAVRYQLVADELRRMIKTPAYAAGGRLPNEEELASRHRVGLPTLRRALEVLQDEGLVEKLHGRGNFVRRPLQRITYVSAPQASDGPSEYTSVSVEVSANEVRSEGALSTLLGVPPGTSLTEYTFLNLEDGAPHSLARVYVPSDLEVAAPAENASLWGEGIREQLSTLGIQAITTAERVTARFPTASERELLRLSARSPVLSLERTTTDTSGRVVEGAFLVLPGDRSEALFTSASAFGKGGDGDPHARCG